MKRCSKIYFARWPVYKLAEQSPKKYSKGDKKREEDRNDDYFAPSPLSPLPAKASPWGMPPLFSDVSPWCLNSLCQRVQLGEVLKSGFNQVHNWPDTTSLSNWMQESAAGCTYKAKGVRCGPCRAQSISYAMHNCTWFPYNPKIYFQYIYPIYPIYISNLCYGVKVLKNDDTSKGAMHNHLRQTVEICNGLTILT